MKTVNAARVEAGMISDAKRFGHHGVNNLIETIRQIHKTTITEERARELLAKAGYGQPKP